MSTATVAYPPTAHLYKDESAQISAVTNVQPSAGAKMTVGSDNDGTRSGKAERLRGGCIPCPVCSVSLVHVRLSVLTGTFRTEACVGSSPYRVAAAKSRRTNTRAATDQRSHTEQSSPTDIADFLTFMTDTVLYSVYADCKFWRWG